MLGAQLLPDTHPEYQKAQDWYRHMFHLKVPPAQIWLKLRNDTELVESTGICVMGETKEEVTAAIEHNMGPIPNVCTRILENVLSDYVRYLPHTPAVLSSKNHVGCLATPILDCSMVQGIDDLCRDVTQQDILIPYSQRISLPFQDIKRFNGLRTMAVKNGFILERVSWGNFALLRYDADAFERCNARSLRKQRSLARKPIAAQTPLKPLGQILEGIVRDCIAWWDQQSPILKLNLRCRDNLNQYIRTNGSTVRSITSFHRLFVFAGQHEAERTILLKWFPDLMRWRGKALYHRCTDTTWNDWFDRYVQDDSELKAIDNESISTHR